jgi:hypothetical protein
MNIRFGAKHTPFIRTPAAKKHIRKFKHLLGVKWEGGMEKSGKSASMFEYLGRYDI